MLGTLIESRRQLEQRSGASLVSVVAHGALIVAAMAATAHQTLDTPKIDEHVVIALDPPRPTPRVDETQPHQRPRLNELTSPPTLSLRAPVTIPDKIPVADLFGALTPVDFSELRAHQARCGIACAVQTDSGSGRDATTWGPADLQMRFAEQPQPPAYPERLRLAGVEGSVVVKFVVDTTGRVDQSTIEVVRSTHDLFTTAVRESLARLRFHPAMAGSRKVRAAAIMPFQFALR